VKAEATMTTRRERADVVEDPVYDEHGRMLHDVALDPSPEPGTVRVRIAVVVWDDGTAMAYDETDDYGPLNGGRLSWVTADVPLPEVAEIAGEVE
jgi:hypothetical protein